MEWSRFSGQLFKHLQAASRPKSQGAIYPFLECNRRLLQQSLMHLDASRLASSLDSHLLPSIGSRLSALKDDSAAASPHGFPGLDVDWAIPRDPGHPWNARGALGPLVIVEHEGVVVWLILPSDSLVQRIDGQLLGDSARHRPPDDLAMPRIYRGRDLELLVVALPSLGHSEHLSPLTWCPENYVPSSLLRDFSPILGAHLLLLLHQRGHRAGQAERQGVRGFVQEEVTRPRRFDRLTRVKCSRA